MTQQFRVLAAFEDDLALIPRACMRVELTTTWNSYSKGSDILLWPPGTKQAYMQKKYSHIK